MVDRRDDIGAYAYGDSRQEELDRHPVLNGPFESAAVPVPVLVEGTGKNGGPDIGVFTVVETPGPRALLDLLLQRVWGISKQP